MSDLWRIVVSRTTLGHAVSGSLASCAAMSFTYPLEKARIYLIAHPEDTSNTFEVLVKICQQDAGVLGLFSGLRPMMAALGTSNLVFFYFHSLLKAVVSNWKQGEQPNVLQSLAIAFAAGCVNVFVTSPLWVSFVRMTGRNAKYEGKTITQVMALVAKEEGVLGLWSGLAPSLMLVSNPTIQFVAFEKIKSFVLHSLHDGAVLAAASADLDELVGDGSALDEDAAIDFLKQTQPEMTGLEAFVVGGLSKLIATILTYPIQVAQTEMRNSSDKYATTLDCLRDIYERKGVANGLFKGFFAKLLQTVLNSAALFLVYEKLSRVVFLFLVRRHVRTAKAV